MSLFCHGLTKGFVMTKKKSGCKSKYFTHVEPRLTSIKNWCKDGEIEATICKRLGVSVSVFNEYKQKYPELVEALKNGKEDIDYMVENSLLKRALGYKYKEVHKMITDAGETITKEILKEVPPDVTAQIYWLKNRKPVQWRDRHEIETSGEIKITFDDQDKDL